MALKLLHPSAIDRLGQARFRREGTLLARLSHAHIARLLDAGVTSGGQPFLVLEYIEGTRIDHFARDRRLDVPARLRLFLQVADAVAHAHANLVVHRDLKPSNIFVDEAGQVKLLDFGIAALVEDGPDRERGTLTRAAGIALTPEYAAPEQAAAGAITTATDVYALGVLLYQLLVGRHPTAADTRTEAEIVRALAEAEPIRPSEIAARLRTDNADTARVLDERRTTSGALRKACQGDLDVIVLHALEKRPDARYRTVAELADDVRRHLENEPIIARPHSVGERMWRFAVRYRLEVALATAAVIALVVGAGVAVWQAREAAAQRDLAYANLERAETASQFVSQMLVKTWGEGERISRDEFLERSERLALEELNDRPLQQAVVLSSLSNFYGSLGNNARAAELVGRAIALLPENADATWRAVLACEHSLNQFFLAQDDTAKATLARWATDPAVEPGVAARCERNLAQIFLNTNDAANALVHAERARQRLDEANEAGPTLRASVHAQLGFAYMQNARSLDAEVEYGKAAAIYRDLDELGTPNAVAHMNNWALVSRNAGDIPRALQVIEEVIAHAKAGAPGTDLPPYLVANRASLLAMLGRYDEAIVQAEDARGVAQRAQARPFEANALIAESAAYIPLGELDEAERRLRIAADLMADFPPDRAEALSLRLRWAELALARHDPVRAAQEVAPVIELFQSRSMRGAPVAHVVEDEAAHGACRIAKEAVAIGKRKRVAIGHLDIGIVQQRGRAERDGTAGTPQLRFGQPVQVVVQHREQRIAGFTIAGLRPRDNLGQRPVRHNGRIVRMV